MQALIHWFGFVLTFCDNSYDLVIQVSNSNDPKRTLSRVRNPYDLVIQLSDSNNTTREPWFCRPFWSQTCFHPLVPWHSDAREIFILQRGTNESPTGQPGWTRLLYCAPVRDSGCRRVLVVVFLSLSTRARCWSVD
jgi:hypothetical protein